MLRYIYWLGCTLGKKAANFAIIANSLEMTAEH